MSQSPPPPDPRPPPLRHPDLPNHSTLPNQTKRKSATLSPDSAQTLQPTPSHFSRSSFRRSFTLPRALLLRKSQNNPHPANNNSLRSLFLTLLRSGKGKREEPNGGLPEGLVPAAVGLKNQGNTCFMNAIVQCLSHTEVLARYLLTDAYKTDLRKKYWIKSGKGEVTEELASILKSTWFRSVGSVVEEAGSKFKAVVERFNPQWRGSEQHDAQEFLIWLLSRLHEDLNLAASTKYKVMKNNFGRPDEQVAAEWLANHVRCNNSIIEEIFGAHFRSSLTCPGCGRQSTSYDFFNMVSLPIPEAEAEVPVFLNVLYLSQQPRLVKLGLSVSSSSDVGELKMVVGADTGIPVSRLIITEIDGEGFHRTFTESQGVSALSRNEAIYCLETPERAEEEEGAGAVLMVLWTNLVVSGDTKVRFGSPYVSFIPRETSFADLQKLLLKEMAQILQPGVLVSEQEEVVGMRVVDGSSEGSVLDPSLDHPLYMEAVDQALSLSDPDVPPHVKLHLEWTEADKDKLILEDCESVEEHSSVGETRTKDVAEQESVVSLAACFEEYTKVEELSPEDTWHCPHCNRKEEGTLFKIGLWTAPHILVIHLKRFRQTAKVRPGVTKISSRVQFPVEGLDLGPHVSQRGKTTEPGPTQAPLTPSPLNGCFGLGSWKDRSSGKRRVGRGVGGAGEESMTYDLFAVCNHHGKDLQSGHYTAFCLNPVEKTWWSFDDTRVSPLPALDELNTPSAYILFYQRRAPPSAPPPPNHWSRPLLKKHWKPPARPPASPAPPPALAPLARMEELGVNGEAGPSPQLDSSHKNLSQLQIESTV